MHILQIFCNPWSTGDSVSRYCSPEKRLIIYSVIWLVLCYLWNSSVCSVVCREQRELSGNSFTCACVVCGEQQALLLVFQLLGLKPCCQRWKCDAQYFLLFYPVCLQEMWSHIFQGLTCRAWGSSGSSCCCWLISAYWSTCLNEDGLF